MPNLIKICAILLIAPTLTACLTTRRLGPPPAPAAFPETLCRALERGDIIPTLTPEEGALIRERFSRVTKDKAKMNNVLRRDLGCIK